MRPHCGLHGAGLAEAPKAVDKAVDDILTVEDCGYRACGPKCEDVKQKVPEGGVWVACQCYVRTALLRLSLQVA